MTVSLPNKPNLIGMDHAALADWFVSIDQPAFRASQLLQWLHQHGITDFMAMTNLSKSLRQQLTLAATVTMPKIVYSQESADGTCKWILELATTGQADTLEKNRIETVYIPEQGRGTLCISSQVGCSLDCTFCSTGRQGFNRNLTTAEIISQVWLAKQALEPRGKIITNVVLMGMGEPLLNLSAVLPALNIMLDDHAYGLSKRRVTLSTAGVVPMLEQLRQASDVSLAVSLHAPNDALRNQLVPVNQKFPLAELMAACQRYFADQPRRRITFEYVMLADINDQLEHAVQLAQLLRDIPSKINLIPFNPFPNSGYQCSPATVISRFAEYLRQKDYVVTIRKTRGDDIAAACGQLVGQVQDRSFRQLRELRYHANTPSKTVTNLSEACE